MVSSGGKAVVLDAGAGYALCVEATASEILRAEWAAGTKRGIRLFAPTIWRYELTSIITKAIHFQQMSERLARRTLQLAGALDIQLVYPDDQLVTQAFDWTLRLKRAAAYDSFYLALAQRLDCELWTVDRKLARAASVTWVRYVGNATTDNRI